MSDFESSSDPLPFTQVDRAVHNKAGLLAGALGIPKPHALGALIGFWDLCSDPRVLEEAVKAGATEIFLDQQTVVRRFRLASSGHDVDPLDLEQLGLLERKGDLFRVRGMSRYLKPIRARLAARERARAAGLASAEARKRLNGTAKPTATSSTAVQQDVQHVFEHPPNLGPTETHFRSGDVRETFEQTLNSTEPRGQRSEVISLETLRAAEAAPPPPKIPKKVKTSKPRDSDFLCADFEEATGSAYAWQSEKDGAAFAWLLKQASLEEIRARWRRGLKTPRDDWEHVRTVAQLRSKWNDLAGPDKSETQGTKQEQIQWQVV